MSVQRFGRYELLTELGRGGMAELHLARLSGIGGFSKLVAVKRMLPHLTQNKQFSDMFINEGRIVARISHPNVCQVFEIGEDAGQLFLVMEYLEGVTWEELVLALPDDPVLKLRAITGVLAQACDGLHHAHELQDQTGMPSPVIHRDISPQNLFITTDGVCKVLDFGVAKMKTDATHTKSGVLKGKIPYMSPEQLRGEDLDRRSDVFATGVLLWEALTQRHLFVRPGEFQMWKAVLEEPIHRPSLWQPAFDAAVDEVVMRALERDRERRFATIRDLAEALRRLGDTCGGAMPREQIGELVRVQCKDRLVARQVELATLDRERVTADVAWRDAPTQIDGPAIGSMILRAEAVPVRPERGRARWPYALAALALIGAGIAIAFAVMQKRPETPAPVAVAAASQSGAPQVATPTAGAPPVATPGAGTPPVAAPTAGAAVAPPVAATPSAPPAKPAAKPGAKPQASKRSASTKRATAPRIAAREDAAPVSSEPGKLSVGAEPTARLYIDGRFIEETPVYLHKLAPGRHELRLVPGSGRAHTRTIKIEPGKTLNLGTVRW